MSAERYFEEASELLSTIESSQSGAIRQAGTIIADTVQKDGWVYLFGSGHSVIPVLDVFPRYGSFVGFRPLMDPRLMWFNVVGPGGAPELLWLEREEGYIQNFLESFNLQSTDSMIVYSHGGLNAAPIEAALYARAKGLKVIVVTSMENYRVSKAAHSSGKKLADCADVAIDNCVPLEDALVSVEQVEKVGAGSTLAVVAISMAMVAESARQLRDRGVFLDTFVSPNVEGVAADHNRQVFQAYRQKLARRG